MIFAHDGRRWLRALLLTLAILAAVECALLAAVAITARVMDDPSPCDCMIVLGGGIDPASGAPKATLAYRLDRAAELYRAGYAPAIIVSGGQGLDEPISEAQSMRDYLIALGIPEASIIMEASSVNTEENMAFSRALMDERGYKSALVVTSDYHLWRALRLAERAGISARGAGSRNSDNPFSVCKNLARETISWLKFILT